MKIAIVTALFGKYTLLNPEIIHDNIDYIAYVDNDAIIPKDTSWEIRKGYDFTTEEEYKNRRNAKLYKVLSPILLNEYEYIIWIDCTHIVKMHPNDIINLMGNADMGLFKHSDRNCIYKEACVVKILKLDNSEYIDGIVNYLRSQNYPINNGLFELSGFVIHNNIRMKQLCLSWWELICKYSSRDQLSLNYCIYKHKIITHTFNGKLNKINSNDIIPRVLNKYL